MLLRGRVFLRGSICCPEASGERFAAFRIPLHCRLRSPPFGRLLCVLHVGLRRFLHAALHGTMVGALLCAAAAAASASAPFQCPLMRPGCRPAGVRRLF